MSHFLSIIACILTIYQVVKLFFVSNKIFSFREWVLSLYAWNYLLAPAITYEFYNNEVLYSMKLNSDEYFGLIIPGYLLFYFGLYFKSTNIFTPSFSQIREYSIPNETMLKNAIYLGIILKFSNDLFPSSLGFFIYLFSSVRFVGAFALYNVNPGKYFFYVILVFMVEFYFALKVAMFHDALMWLIFFILFYIYVKKPSISKKIIGLIGFIFFILTIQFLKGDYRQSTWSGERESGISTAIELAKSNTNKNAITGEDNIKGTLNRSNQAWILASTIDNMNTFQNFQGLNNVFEYLIAALFPRFLLKDKIKSGNQEHFNRFSGHQIGEGTSMGLGIFADGYIAYGKWGLWIFGFALGLIFSFSFKLVERWTKISPFYLMFLLPMLNYAARPDCETQTTINQISKSILFFGSLVWLTKNRFSLKRSFSGNIFLRETRAVKRFIGISKFENKVEVQSHRIRKLMGKNK